MLTKIINTAISGKARSVESGENLLQVWLNTREPFLREMIRGSINLRAQRCPFIY